MGKWVEVGVVGRLVSGAPFTPLVDADVVKKQLLVDLSLVFSQANTQKRLGWGPPEDWQATIELLKQYRGLEGTQPATAYYTNDFLP